jgi:ABC-type dipeptide/oligopeptide/nickel transport system permease component
MLLVMTIVFFVIRLGPYDPAYLMLGDYVEEQKIIQLKHSLGLDLPLHSQYLQFLSEAARLNLGKSYYSGENVISLLGDVLPNTLELLVAAMLAGIALGIIPGILAAVRPNSAYDHFLRLGTLVGVSIPEFVIGLFLIALFALKLSWFPAIGGSGSDHFLERLSYLILPAFSIGIGMMAGIARLTRAAMLEVLSKNYIETARAKGVKEVIVIFKHAFRNALLPLITYLGILINYLLGAAVIVEIVFTRPGVGRLIVDAIKNADFPVVQLILMFYAGSVVLVNLMVDIAYSLVDPRIAYE